MTLVNADTGEIVCTLEECEAVIERGLSTFREVGNALATVRDAGLYRQAYETFEDYCEQRWNLKRQRAYELMTAAGVADAVSEISDTGVAREAHAAALLPLADDPEAMATALAAAEEATNGKVTAAAIADAVTELTLDMVAERYPFLAHLPAPAKEVLATAKALDALEPGDELERRLVSARKWADMKRRQAAEPPKEPDPKVEATKVVTRALDGLVAWNVDMRRARDVWTKADIDADLVEEWHAAYRIARDHFDALIGLTKPRIRRVK